MSLGYSYDEHTLFIKCDCASADQIRFAFREALTKYQKDTGKPFDCRFRVNLVENREGKSFGVGFVFLTNPAAYYMFLGKNPDGSDRIASTDGFVASVGEDLGVDRRQVAVGTLPRAIGSGASLCARRCRDRRGDFARGQ